MSIEIRVDPRPPLADFAALSTAAWGHEHEGEMEPIWSHSLAHLGAYEGGRLVGYVNIAWDGGMHAFILDTMVHPDHQRRGIATALVKRAANIARKRGATWLHVDYEPHLDGFYKGCGFAPTLAGLIRLDR